MRLSLITQDCFPEGSLPYYLSASYEKIILRTELSYLDKVVQNLFLTLGNVISDTISILEGIQVNLNLLARIGMVDRIS